VRFNPENLHLVAFRFGNARALPILATSGCGTAAFPTKEMP
jgi:hypothetical protein